MGRFTAVLLGDRQRVLGRVSRPRTWDEHLPTRYNARTARPVINRTRPAAKDGHAALGATGAREALSSITDHPDAKVYSAIDVRLWDQAGWASTAYGTLDSREIPFLALTFRDHKAAEAIFHRWHDRFGDEDKEEDIYIDIIRELPSQPRSHYGMIVTSRIPEDLSDVKITATVSRSLTMQPADDINLETFLQHFARAGEYLLLGMIIESGQSPRIIPRSGILKRALHVKQATEIAQREPEGVFLSLRDPI